MRTLICLFGLLMCATGCDGVMTKSPIGKPWKDAEVSSLDGTWIFKTAGLTLSVVGQKDGRAQGGMINPELKAKDPASNSLQLIRVECMFTRVGKHEFLFFKGIEEEKEAAKDEDAPPDAYDFFLITKRTANTATLALPTDEFQKLVESGKLPGKVYPKKKNSHTVIDADEKAFLEAIESVGLEKCFELKKPETAERVAPQKM